MGVEFGLEGADTLSSTGFSALPSLEDIAEEFSLKALTHCQAPVVLLRLRWKTLQRGSEFKGADNMSSTKIQQWNVLF